MRRRHYNPSRGYRFSDDPRYRPGRCVLCSKCWIIREGYPNAGMCALGGPFSGFVDEDGNEVEPNYATEVNS